MSEMDPVNILGELIEDAVIRYSGQIGTLASAHVAEEVIAHLRAHPEDAAAALGVLLVDYPWREVTGG